jgi:hypothetical protein
MKRSTAKVFFYICISSVCYPKIPSVDVYHIEAQQRIIIFAIDDIQALRKTEHDFRIFTFNVTIDHWQLKAACMKADNHELQLNRIPFVDLYFCSII